MTDNFNQSSEMPAICPDCGKVMREIREGSLTSWIFLESRCQCQIAGANKEGLPQGKPPTLLPKQPEPPVPAPAARVPQVSAPPTPPVPVPPPPPASQATPAQGNAALKAMQAQAHFGLENRSSGNNPAQTPVAPSAKQLAAIRNRTPETPSPLPSAPVPPPPHAPRPQPQPQIAPAADPYADGDAQIERAIALKANQTDSIIGSVIGGHFQINSLIGEGGMSRVYRALHLLLNRQVAVKYIHPKFLYDQKSVRRFQQEAKAASALKHPNICSVNEFGVDAQGRSFLVMDLIDGESLSTLVKRQGKVPLLGAIDIIIQVCNGLSHAHSKNVVHRDIKPGNMVIVQEDGADVVKLVDFGIAKVTDSEDGNGQNLTRTGEVLGTPNYMSPEQCVGKKVDSRSDVYSVGCVFYELVTGRAPFEADHTLGVLLGHVNEEAEPVPDSSPPGLTRIIARAMKKNPDDRYQQIREFAEELEALKKKLSTPAPKGSGQGWQPDGIIADRYRLMEVIGQGGMGTVFKASHVTLSKYYAIKVLNAGRNLDDLSQKRFEQEAQAGSKLSHPNLVAVIDYGFTPEMEPYLVMEYVDGASLDHVLSLQGRLQTAQFLDIFVQSCKALAYIHRSGIVHRDLKTSNIIVQVIDDDQYVKLLDFGIAKILSEDTSQHLTATGMVFGSPLYMSPEQCMGKNIDVRSDIYSLGCVMYECFSGSHPLEGENALDTLQKHIREVPKLLGQTGSERDMAIGLLIQKCLEKDPALRFQSASELLAGLNAINNGMPGISPVPPVVFTPISSAPPVVPVPQPQPIPPEERLDPEERRRMLDALKAPSQSMPAMRQDANSSVLRKRFTSSDLSENLNDVGASQSLSGSHHLRDREAQQNQATTGSGRFREEKPPRPSSAGWIAVAVVAAIAIPGVYFAATSIHLPSFAPASVTGTSRAEDTFKQGQSRYADAKAQFEEALIQAKKDKDDEAIGRIKSRLGRIALSEHSVTEAQADFEEARQRLQFRTAENKDHYLDAVLGLAECLLLNKNQTRAEEYFKEARELSKGEDPMRQADILVASAQNSSQFNSEQALKFYDDAIEKYSKLFNAPGDKIAIALAESAKICQRLGKYSEVTKRENEAKAKAQSLDASVQQAVNDRLSEIREANNSPIGAPMAVRAVTVTSSPPASSGLVPVQTYQPVQAVQPAQPVQAIPTTPVQSSSAPLGVPLQTSSAPSSEYDLRRQDIQLRQREADQRDRFWQLYQQQQQGMNAITKQMDSHGAAMPAQQFRAVDSTLRSNSTVNY